MISSTTSQSSFCALPRARTCAPSGRPSAPQVLRGAVRPPRPALAARNNGPGQVRLREQQGVAREAVAYRVVHPVPPPLFGTLRLHARRPSLQIAWYSRQLLGWPVVVGSKPSELGSRFGSSPSASGTSAWQAVLRLPRIREIWNSCPGSGQPPLL